MKPGRLLWLPLVGALLACIPVGMFDNRNGGSDPWDTWDSGEATSYGNNCTGGTSSPYQAVAGAACSGSIVAECGEEVAGYPAGWRCDMDTCTWVLVDVCDSQTDPDCNWCGNGVCGTQVCR